MKQRDISFDWRFRQGFLAVIAILGLCFLTTSSAMAAGLFGPRFIKRNTCSSSDYQHVWVTVSDVLAHMGKSGWVSLTPGLAMAPMQVDLLNATSTECFLASLGYTSGLPVGRYQQILVILWNNVGPGKGHGHGKGKGKGGGGSVTPPETNYCSSIGTYDCVQLADNSFHPLFVNAETHTGLRIPPGQIARGGLDVTTGEVLDLDLDFDVCSSVVEAGHSGKFILKPALTHGEADVSPLLNGTIVVGSRNGETVTPNTSSPVAGANVYLESQSQNVTIYPVASPATTAPVENLLATTTTFADGGFAFCAPPAGDYEIVSDADPMPVTNNSSNATITTDVAMTAEGATAGTIPLLDDGTGPALLESLFTTQNTTSPPGAGDLINYTGTQPFTGTANTTVQAIVPPLPGTMPALPSTTSVGPIVNDGTLTPIPPPATVATASTPNAADCPNITPAPTCPTGTNCACFTLALPNSNPVIGSATNGSYTAPAGNSADYSVVGYASKLDGSGTPECSPSALITDPATPIAMATNPLLIPTPVLEFTGCD
ncbi:DUF4382 domain-containing protein [bacterium]|nr:DUF4382 domain-containing protein [bacterium]